MVKSKRIHISMVFAIYLYIFISISTMTNKNSVGYIGGDLHIIILYSSAFAFLVLAPTVHFLLGALGGAVHYFVSSALLETGLIGRTIAIGAAAAYLLQYLVQILADSNLFLLLLIITGGITLILILKIPGSG